MLSLILGSADCLPVDYVCSRSASTAISVAQIAARRNHSFVICYFTNGINVGFTYNSVTQMLDGNPLSKGDVRGLWGLLQRGSVTFSLCINIALRRKHLCMLGRQTRSEPRRFHTPSFRNACWIGSWKLDFASDCFVSSSLFPCFAANIGSFLQTLLFRD